MWSLRGIKLLSGRLFLLIRFGRCLSTSPLPWAEPAALWFPSIFVAMSFWLTLSKPRMFSSWSCGTIMLCLSRAQPRVELVLKLWGSSATLGQFWGIRETRRKAGRHFLYDFRLYISFPPQNIPPRTFSGCRGTVAHKHQLLKIVYKIVSASCSSLSLHAEFLLK